MEHARHLIGHELRWRKATYYAIANDRVRGGHFHLSSLGILRISHDIRSVVAVSVGFNAQKTAILRNTLLHACRPSVYLMYIVQCLLCISHASRVQVQYLPVMTLHPHMAAVWQSQWKTRACQIGKGHDFISQCRTAADVLPSRPGSPMLKRTAGQTWNLPLPNTV